MKKLLKQSVIAVLSICISLTSCKKCDFLNFGESHYIQYKPRYTTVPEFRQGIAQVINLVQQYHIIAYLDTLPNGYPNIFGRKAPLSQFGGQILEKLGGNQQQVESAVYDVFHFDEATFSLISYIMKAQMVSDISPQTMVYILAFTPLPPFAVANFQAPVDPVANMAPANDCCKDCNPQVKILVTWGYKTPCGNREKKLSGYAANNTLNHMSGGKQYRFDAEVTGCDCPGNWTSTVTPPTGASYGASERGSSATVFPVTSGTYTITFSYKVCDKVITKTFTLTVD